MITTMYRFSKAFHRWRRHQFCTNVGHCGNRRRYWLDVLHRITFGGHWRVGCVCLCTLSRWRPFLGLLCSSIRTGSGCHFEAQTSHEITAAEGRDHGWYSQMHRLFGCCGCMSQVPYGVLSRSRCETPCPVNERIYKQQKPRGPASST